MNLHTPERQPTESQADYRKRQQASKRAVQAMTLSKIHKQHSLPSQRQELRDAQRENNKAPRGIYADAIGWNAAKTRAEEIKGRTYHDENGAYTRVGRKLAFNGETIRRMWLAGISAQRGY